MTHAVYPSLAGKTVVITGGGSGIGEVMVEGFARQKARVFFLDVAATESQALVARLGNGTKFLQCDVTDTAALQKAIADIEAQAGPVSVLVNNAANDDRHRLEEVTPAYWEQRIAVNLRHLFFATQSVVPGMKKAGGGSIINLGSVSWHSAIPELSVYETAKAGIEGLTRALARELGSSAKPTSA
jgi:D-xylose 1-dehydrogenase